MVTRLLLVLFVCCVRAMNYVVYVLQAILTLLLLLCVSVSVRLYFCFAKKNREPKTFRFCYLAETKKEHVSSEMAYQTSPHTCSLFDLAKKGCSRQDSNLQPPA